jgi:hypothetical protein
MKPNLWNHAPKQKNLPIHCRFTRVSQVSEEEWGSSHNALHLIIIHNYDFQRTFGEKLLKYIAILAPYISFFQRYVFIFVLFKNLIKLFLTCLVQELFFSYVNYAL